MMRLTSIMEIIGLALAVLGVSLIWLPLGLLLGGALLVFLAQGMRGAE